MTKTFAVKKDIHVMNSSTTQMSNPAVGDRIEVLWPLEGQFFLVAVQSKTEDGKLNINCDDGENEQFSMENEAWNLTSIKYSSNTTNDSNNSSLDNNKTEENVPDTTQDLSSTSVHSLISTAQSVLASMFENFGNRWSFLKFKAQSLSSNQLSIVYETEERNFKIPLNAFLFKTYHPPPILSTRTQFTS